MIPSSIDYSALFNELSKEFFGRDWLVELAVNFIQASSDRYLLIQGEPGIGKSAIAGKFVRAQMIHACHFCITRRSETLDPMGFVYSLSSQLATALPGFVIEIPQPKPVEIHADVRVEKVESGGTVKGIEIENLVFHPASPNEAFLHYITNPLNKWAGEHGTGACVVLLVDALDEGERLNQHPNIIDLIFSAQGLPDMVRWILTARPGGSWSNIPGMKAIHLEQQEENQRDVDLYVGFIAEQYLAGCKPEKVNLTRFKAELADRSEGNFLYLRYVMQSIREKTATGKSPIELENLPVGLSGMYSQFLERIFGNHPSEEWRTIFAPVMGVLAVEQEGLSFKQVSHLSGVEPQETHEALLAIEQFLENTQLEGERRYRIYHISFAEFLTDRKVNQRWWIDPERIHKKIARLYLDQYQDDWRNCDEYGLRFLTMHLAQGKLYDELHRLVGKVSLSQKDWRHARLDQEKGLKGYLGDINLGMRIADQQMKAGALWHLRYAVIHSSLVTQSKRLTPGMLAYALQHKLVHPPQALDLANLAQAREITDWMLLAAAPFQDDATCRVLLRRFGVRSYSEYYTNHGLILRLLENFLDRRWEDEILEMLGKVTSLQNWVSALRRIVHKIPVPLRARISNRLLDLSSAGSDDEASYKARTGIGEWTAGALAIWAGTLPEEERGEYIEKARLRLIEETLKNHTWVKAPTGSTLPEIIHWCAEGNHSGNSEEYFAYYLPFFEHIPLEYRARCLELIPIYDKYPGGHADQHRHMLQFSMALRYLESHPTRKTLARTTLNFWRFEGVGWWMRSNIWPDYFQGLSPVERSFMANFLLQSSLPQKGGFNSSEPALLRAKVLANLAPFLSGSEQRSALNRAMNLLFDVQDWIDEVDGIIAIDSCFPQLSKGRIEQVYHAAMKIGDRGEQHLVTAACFPEKSGRLGKAVISAMMPPFHQLDDQVKYWQDLSNFAHQNGCIGSDAPEKWDWSNLPADQMERIDEYISRMQHADIHQAFETEGKKNQYWNGSNYPYLTAIHLLCMQAAQAGGRRRVAFLKQALRVAHKEGHPLVYGDFLREILPFFDQETQEAITTKKLSWVHQHHSSTAVAISVAGLLPYTPLPLRIQEVRETLLKTLEDYGGQFHQEHDLDSIFLLYSNLWRDLTAEDLLELFAAMMKNMQHWHRQDFLSTLATLVPMLEALLDKDCCSEIVAITEEILTVWP